MSDFARLVQHELVRPAEESRKDVWAESCKMDGETVTVCAWTNRVLHQGKWIPSGHYLHQHLGMQVTHGMAEDFQRRVSGWVITARRYGYERSSVRIKRIQLQRFLRPRSFFKFAHQHIEDSVQSLPIWLLR